MAEKFGGLRLNRDSIEYNRGNQRLVNVVASIATVAELRGRVDPAHFPSTRLLGLGPKRDRDPQELMLVVESPIFQWLIPVEPQQSQAAEAFVDKVNTAARAFGPAPALTASKILKPGAAATSPGSSNLVDALTELARLHSAGALTDSEFAAAKARLLP